MGVAASVNSTAAGSDESNQSQEEKKQPKEEEQQQEKGNKVEQVKGEEEKKSDRPQVSDATAAPSSAPSSAMVDDDLIASTSPSIDFPQPWVFPITTPIHQSVLYSTLFLPRGLETVHPPRWTQPNKIYIADKMRQHAAARQQSSSSKNEETLLRFSRYTSDKLPIDSPCLQGLRSTTTRSELVRGVYDYIGDNKVPDGGESYASSHFWVNFGDKHMFRFYRSDLFAQDEWMVMEHPILPSVREYLLNEMSSKVEAAPLTVTERGLPTPCILMNVARRCELDVFGKNLYGNEFIKSSHTNLDEAFHLLEEEPTTPLSNVIVMECLKHGEGKYSTEEIETILKTAFTAFSAAKFEARDEATRNSKSTPSIVVHTGNWGCGAFGGNIQLMCLLQVCAAQLAGIDRLVYHTLTDEHEELCQAASEQWKQIVRKLFQKKKEEDGGGGEGEEDDEDEAGEELTLDTLTGLIEDLGMRWGVASDT